MSVFLKKNDEQMVVSRNSETLDGLPILMWQTSRKTDSGEELYARGISEF